MTIKACVIGWPIEHSRSPLIHGYWLRHHGIDGSYTKEAVEPENLVDFLKGLDANGFAGCNVTVPTRKRHLHKRTGRMKPRKQSALRIRSGLKAMRCARRIPTPTAFWQTSMRRRPAGRTAPEALSCSAPAVRPGR